MSSSVQRGHGSIGTMVLGSVSAEIVDHAHCPVLVARGHGIGRVILATDGSSYARTAEQVISGWRIFGGSGVEVVSVADPRLPWTSSLALSASPVAGDDYADTERKIVDGYRRIADDAARRLSRSGIAAQARVLQGDPASELRTRGARERRRPHRAGHPRPHRVAPAARGQRRKERDAPRTLLGDDRPRGTRLT